MLQRFAISSLCRSSPSWFPSCTAAVGIPTTNTVQTTLVSPQPEPPTFLQLPQQAQQQIRCRSSRSQRGLYDGKDVSFGNNVPFSLKKTRRRWNPNVQYKRVYSEVLDEMIKFHITTSALRSIDKYGGLDEYLLRSKHVSTKGEGEGQRIRNRIIQTMKHRELLKTQAIEKGEDVDDWDKITLVGKKMKAASSESTSVNEEA